MQRRNRSGSFVTWGTPLAIAAAVAAMQVACGGGTPSGAQAPANAATSAAASTGATAPSATSGSALEESEGSVEQQYATAKAAPSATLVQSGPGDDDLGKGLKELAAKSAPGMQPEGPMMKATLAENGHAQASITLVGGKCYAIVGYSPTVVDFDLNVFDPAGVISYQDATDDNKPVIGRSTEPLCPDSKTPITFLLDLESDKGAGDVAAQVFSKSN